MFFSFSLLYSEQPHPPSPHLPHAVELAVRLLVLRLVSRIGLFVQQTFLIFIGSQLETLSFIVLDPGFGHSVLGLASWEIESRPQLVKRGYNRRWHEL